MRHPNPFWKIAALAALLAVPSLAGAADTFEVDGVHSAVIVRVKHLGVSQAYGRFNEISGSFTLDEKEPSKRPETAAALRRRLRACRAFGEWDGEHARHWWSDNSGAVRERRAAQAKPGPGDPSTGGPSPGSLLSVDTRTRRP